MNALVTGGNGFLGQYLVEQLLARGDSVCSFSRNSSPQLSALGVAQIQGDLRDAPAVAAACQGIDCVFHTAALAGIAVHPTPFYEINERGTRHVIEGCRRHRVGRLVYTSSPSVTFAGSDQCGVDESTPLALDWLSAHRAFYSHSKALAEQQVLAANAPDLRTCALRPHLIWGPRDRHLVPRLLQRARRGRLRRVGDATNRVDMIYVENAAAAHWMAADALDRPHAPVAGRAYFLSQGEPVGCWQWIDQLLALVDLPPVGKAISRGAAQRLGGWLERGYRLLGLRGEPPMTRFLAAQLATSHWFDISSAREDFGYRPQISTAEGMNRLQQFLTP